MRWYSIADDCRLLTWPVRSLNDGHVKNWGDDDHGVPRLTRVATTCAVLGLATTAQADLLVDVQSGSAFQRGSFANFGYTVTFNESVRVNGLDALGSQCQRPDRRR